MRNWGYFTPIRGVITLVKTGSRFSFTDLTFWNYCSSRESSHSFMGNSPTLTRGKLIFWKRRILKLESHVTMLRFLVLLGFQGSMTLVRIVVYVSKVSYFQRNDWSPGLIEIEHNGHRKWQKQNLYDISMYLGYLLVSIFDFRAYPTPPQKTGALSIGWVLGTAHCL